MKNIIALFILFTSLVSFSQQVIELQNPSFEDAPRKGGSFLPPITNWDDCGARNFQGESAPDIHPVVEGAWEVSLPAKDGKTYIGLVTRYNNTYESVSQQLSEKLKVGSCYSISVYMAVSENYKSATRRTIAASYDARKKKQPIYPTENFIQPVELLIWAGSTVCGRGQLLVHSGAIRNKEWTQYTLEFSPNNDYDYLTFGAFFEYGYSAPYNGHILLDGISPITEIDCK